MTATTPTLKSLAPLAAVLAMSALQACSKTPEPPSSNPSSNTAASPASATGASSPSGAASAPSSPANAQAAKVTWTDPANWKRRPPSNAMRTAEYVVPKTGSDTEDAEMTVSTAGGTVDANIERWVHQFEQAKDAAPKKKALEVAGLKVTTIDVTGAYTGMAAGAAAAKKTGYRLLGAVVETPTGALWFFKLTGPEKTVTHASVAFDALILSLKPG